MDSGKSTQCKTKEKKNQEGKKTNSERSHIFLHKQETDVESKQERKKYRA